MFNRLKALYDTGRIDKEQLELAVRKGWISEEQVGEILAGKKS